MKTRLMLLLCLALTSVVAPSYAAEKAAITLPTVEGVVKKIDLASNKVTLAHGDIPNLNMPPMTMPYVVKVPAELKPLHEGNKVKFTADKVGKVYTVIHIEVVK